MKYKGKKPPNKKDFTQLGLNLKNKIKNQIEKKTKDFRHLIHNNI
jgi:hypothetical protein